MPQGDALLDQAEGGLHIAVEPVGLCNLYCVHCSLDLSHLLMSEPVFERVLDGAVELAAVELAFIGGEPLMHPRALEWIERARAAGLRVAVFTNGTLVAADVAARLAGAGVAKVIVGLDGFEGENDFLRGAGSFGAAVAGIRLLVAAGIATWIATLVHHGNEERHPAFARWCREELGVRGVRTRVLPSPPPATNDPQRSLREHTFRDAYDAAKSPKGDDAAKSPKGDDAACGAHPADRVFVSAAGDVRAAPTL